MGLAPDGGGPGSWCGKKGPPLAPFVRVPAAVATIAPQRVGNDIYVSFSVPDTNVDGQKPADIGAVEVYAVTSDSPPVTEDQRAMATVVATLPVRPILPDLPIPDTGSVPPLPLPPGVDRGAAVAILEPLTADARMPVEMPVERTAPDRNGGAKYRGKLRAIVGPAPTQLPRRHYFVVSKSPRGRRPAVVRGIGSARSRAARPGSTVVHPHRSDMTIAWPRPRCAHLDVPAVPTVKP